MTIDTPETIYLMEIGEGIVWCEDSAPGPDMKSEDSVKYIRADIVELGGNYGNDQTEPRQA